MNWTASKCLAVVGRIVSSRCVEVFICRERMFARCVSMPLRFARRFGKRARGHTSSRILNESFFRKGFPSRGNSTASRPENSVAKLSSGGGHPIAPFSDGAVRSVGQHHRREVVGRPRPSFRPTSQRPPSTAWRTLYRNTPPLSDLPFKCSGCGSRSVGGVPVRALC